MNLLPDVMFDLTLGEILRYYRNYQIRQSKDWEKHRFVAWFGSLPYRNKSDSSTPYDIIQLMTDPSEEEINEIKQSEEKEAMDIIAQYKEQGLI